MSGSIGTRVKNIHWKYVPSAVLRRLNRYDFTHPYTMVLARVLPFIPPATLILSYPRSGSSWVGKIVSFSPDFAYLREPVTQAYIKTYREGALIDPYRDSVTLERYTHFADQAFAGISSPGVPWVIKNLEAFSIANRRNKTLLIKEVNPLAAGFFVRRYAPKVVLVLRHPVAVADSFRRIGWLTGGFEEFGYNYGMDMARAIESIETGWAKILRFEDLALDPQRQFHDLFAALGVRKPLEFERVIADYCEGAGNSEDPYELQRSSRDEVDKWRENVSQADIAAVMRGYERSGLKYYLE